MQLLSRCTTKLDKSPWDSMKLKYNRSSAIRTGPDCSFAPFCPAPPTIPILPSARRACPLSISELFNFMPRLFFAVSTACWSVSRPSSLGLPWLDQDGTAKLPDLLRLQCAPCSFCLTLVRFSKPPLPHWSGLHLLQITWRARNTSLVKTGNVFALSAFFCSNICCQYSPILVDGCDSTCSSCTSIYSSIKVETLQRLITYDRLVATFLKWAKQDSSSMNCGLRKHRLCKITFFYGSCDRKYSVRFIRKLLAPDLNVCFSPRSEDEIAHSVSSLTSAFAFQFAGDWVATLCLSLSRKTLSSWSIHTACEQGPLSHHKERGPTVHFFETKTKNRWYFRQHASPRVALQKKSFIRKRPL